MFLTEVPLVRFMGNQSMHEDDLPRHNTQLMFKIVPDSDHGQDEMSKIATSSLTVHKIMDVSNFPVRFFVD